MTAAEAMPELDAPAHDRAFLGHPKGLGYLSFVEGCERFSYYSMQSLLVLYMTKYLLLPENIGNVAGLDWLRSWHYEGLEGQPLASAIFGDYTSLVYLTPILGGLIADRWLGRRVTLILGGVVMALGHFLMAFEGMFLLALISLIVGVGLFKGNIASQVGELYGPNDLRRAMAFQIFYIAINVSVIAAPLISGTLGEKVGWHYGFGTAGVVMVAGLLLINGFPDAAADAMDLVAEASAARLDIAQNRAKAIAIELADADPLVWGGSILAARASRRVAEALRAATGRVVLSADANTDYSEQWSAAQFPAREGRRDGDTVIQVATSSYLNHVLANGLVLLPDYVAQGTPPARQQQVKAIYEAAFPGRTVRFIDVTLANWVGGGAHCATPSEPAPQA